MRLVRSRLSAVFLLITAGSLVSASDFGVAQTVPTVTVTQPIAKRVTNWEEYSGRFVAVETVEIRARVSGFIDKVHFRDGQIVKAGDPLFTIDPRPFEIAL